MYLHRLQIKWDHREKKILNINKLHILHFQEYTTVRSGIRGMTANAIICMDFHKTLVVDQGYFLKKYSASWNLNKSSLTFATILPSSFYIKNINWVA
jgi:hypothetical protein